MVEQVYAWAVEFPARVPEGRTQVAFFPNDGKYDETYALNYAARLHRQVIQLFKDRRHHDDGQAK